MASTKESAAEMDRKAPAKAAPETAKEPAKTVPKAEPAKAAKKPVRRRHGPLGR